MNNFLSGLTPVSPAVPAPKPASGAPIMEAGLGSTMAPVTHEFSRAPYSMVGSMRRTSGAPKMEF